MLHHTRCRVMYAIIAATTLRTNNGRHTSASVCVAACSDVCRVCVCASLCPVMKLSPCKRTSWLSDWRRAKWGETGAQRTCACSRWWLIIALSQHGAWVSTHQTLIAHTCSGVIVRRRNTEGPGAPERNCLWSRLRRQFWCGDADVDGFRDSLAIVV